MNITQAISHIHPTLKFNIDFRVDDEGKGPKLVWFNKKILEPTHEELELAWVEVQAIEKLRTDSLARKEAILKIATLTDQMNLMAREIYKLTANSTDPETIEARKKFEKIQTVLTI